MMPDVDPRKERVRQRARAGLSIISVAVTVLLLTHTGGNWVPVAFAAAVAVIAPIAATGDLPGGRGRGPQEGQWPQRPRPG